jgi:hypothetical protein
VKNLKVTAGKPFDQSELDKDLAGLQDRYGSHGFIFAEIKCDRRLSEDKPELDLVYTITEGKQYRVGRVEIHGADSHNKFNVIADRMSLRPGDIIDCGKLHDDEKRLKFTSVFPSKGSIPKLEIGRSSEHPNGQHFEQTTLDLHLLRNAADSVEAVLSWPSDPPRFEAWEAGLIAH